MIFFFFSSRRRHTRLQGDWSSDVCSSDLDGSIAELGPAVALMSWIVGGAAVARLGLERPSPARPIPAPAQTRRKAERLITPLHNLSDASEIAMRRRRSPDSMFYASSASARSKRNVVKAIPDAAFSLA